jgi:hypothetical protein
MVNKYFEFWDPMKGHSSWAPINNAQMIPFKARAILKNRTASELGLMVAFVNQKLNNYYKSDWSRVVDEVTNDENWELVEIDEDGHIIDMSEEGKEKYNLVDDRYPFVFAVEYALNGCDLDIDFPPTITTQPKECELWASLCLSEYAKYVYDLEHIFDYKSLEHVERKVKKYTDYEIVKFSNQLLESYELLTVATALHTEDKVEDKTKQQYKKSQDQIKLRRVEISKNANLVRHNKTNNLKQTILSEWEKAKDSFSTIKEAGDHFEEVMNAQGYKITTETIRGYISEHAKSIGFTFPRQQKK